MSPQNIETLGDGFIQEKTKFQFYDHVLVVRSFKCFRDFYLHHAGHSCPEGPLTGGGRKTSGT